MDVNVTLRTESIRTDRVFSWYRMIRSGDSFIGTVVNVCKLITTKKIPRNDVVFTTLRTHTLLFSKDSICILVFYASACSMDVFRFFDGLLTNFV